MGKAGRCAGHGCQYNRKRSLPAFGAREAGLKTPAQIYKVCAEEASVLVIPFFKKMRKMWFNFPFFPVSSFLFIK